MRPINLLPWRAQQRRQAYRQCLVHAAAAIGGALMLSYLVIVQGWHVAFAQPHPVSMEPAATVSLATPSPTYAVALLQMLPELVGTHTQLNHIDYQHPQLTIDGVANSHQSVVNFLQQLQTVPWIEQAQLHQLTHTTATAITPYTFTVHATIRHGFLPHDLHHPA